MNYIHQREMQLKIAAANGIDFSGRTHRYDYSIYQGDDYVMLKVMISFTNQGAFVTFWHKLHVIFLQNSLGKVAQTTTIDIIGWSS